MPSSPERKKELEALGHELVTAAQDGAVENVKKLLQAGVNPNYLDPSSYGRTALTAACKAGHLAIAQALIEAGADVNRKDKFATSTDWDRSQTPLSAACDCDKKPHNEVAALVAYLLERGADVRAAQPKGRDGAVHFAAEHGHAEVVKMLLARKASAKRQGTNKYTPLMRAMEGGSLAIVKMLIDKGADIFATVAYKHTAFDLLITEKKANVDIARLLIELGADFKKYKADYGPLGRAACYGNKEIVELMIEKGAKVSTKNREGATPMDEAIRGENYEVVKLLLAHGADPDSRDRSGFGKTLLQYAVTTGAAELVRDVRKAQEEKKKKTSGSPLPAGEGLGVRAQNTGALVQAAKSGQLPSVKVLVESGLDVDDRDTWRNETALMTAAGQGQGEIVSYLVENGANVHAQDARGNRPLDYAAAENKVEAMKVLMAHGADIRSKNNLGWNALMQAALTGRYEAAEMLLKAGSPVNEIDQEKGASTLFLARHGGGERLAGLFKSYGAVERVIRERKPGEPYFLITDCDICTYLPHHKTELTHDYSPEEIDGLEVIYEDHASDYKADTTNMIKKCRHCGTYYHQYHFVDTEDPIGGIGADFEQNLWRIGLMNIQLSMQSMDRKEEVAEIKARYPGIVQAFIALSKAKVLFKPYVRPYVAETLVEYFTMQKDWDSIREILLGHPDTDFGRDAVKYMRLCSNMTLAPSDPPTASDLVWADVKKKYNKMIKQGAAVLKDFPEK